MNAQPELVTAPKLIAGKKGKSPVLLTSCRYEGVMDRWSFLLHVRSNPNINLAPMRTGI